MRNKLLLAITVILVLAFALPALASKQEVQSDQFANNGAQKYCQMQQNCQVQQNCSINQANCGQYGNCGMKAPYAGTACGTEACPKY